MCVVRCCALLFSAVRCLLFVVGCKVFVAGRRLPVVG